jgi:hypothetical protein
MTPYRSREHAEIWVGALQRGGRQPAGPSSHTWPGTADEHAATLLAQLRATRFARDTAGRRLIMNTQGCRFLSRPVVGRTACPGAVPGGNRAR